MTPRNKTRLDERQFIVGVKREEGEPTKVISVQGMNPPQSFLIEDGKATIYEDDTVNVQIVVRPKNLNPEPVKPAATTRK